MDSLWGAKDGSSAVGETFGLLYRCQLAGIMHFLLLYFYPAIIFLNIFFREIVCDGKLKICPSFTRGFDFPTEDILLILHLRFEELSVHTYPIKF